MQWLPSYAWVLCSTKPKDEDYENVCTTIAKQIVVAKSYNVDATDIRHLNDINNAFKHKTVKIDDQDTIDSNNKQTKTVFYKNVTDKDYTKSIRKY